MSCLWGWYNSWSSIHLKGGHGLSNVWLTQSTGGAGCWGSVLCRYLPLYNLGFCVVRAGLDCDSDQLSDQFAVIPALVNLEVTRQRDITQYSTPYISVECQLNVIKELVFWIEWNRRPRWYPSIFANDMWNNQEEVSQEIVWLSYRK